MILHAILGTDSGTKSVGVGTNEVISQTHWLVSWVRLPQWRECLAFLSTQWRHLTSGGSNFTAGVSHHISATFTSMGEVGSALFSSMFNSVEVAPPSHTPCIPKT